MRSSSTTVISSLVLEPKSTAGSNTCKRFYADSTFHCTIYKLGLADNFAQFAALHLSYKNNYTIVLFRNSKRLILHLCIDGV